MTCFIFAVEIFLRVILIFIFVKSPSVWLLIDNWYSVGSYSTNCAIALFTSLMRDVCIASLLTIINFSSQAEFSIKHPSCNFIIILLQVTILSVTYWLSYCPAQNSIYNFSRILTMYRIHWALFIKIWSLTSFTPHSIPSSSSTLIQSGWSFINYEPMIILHSSINSIFS